MVDVGWFKAFLEPFGWFLDLGKEDAQHIRAEIADLLQHCSQSLRSLLELSDVLEEIPEDEFDAKRFLPIFNHCHWFFTSPEAAQKARTHCTDIDRDIGRIQFKMAKVLRAENRDWKGLNAAFDALMDADRTFLQAYEEELARLGVELDAIHNQLQAGRREHAWRKYEDLRESLLTDRRALSDEIARMQQAQTHVHELLT